MRARDREYLFVDGYNIINSWEILKELKDIDLESARDKLMEILSEYKHYSGIEIILVFDAHMVKGSAGTEIDYKGLKVVYTRENDTADHYIEREVNELGRIRRVRVATSDWMEQQIVLGRGGTRISARELEMEIFDQKKLVKRRRKADKIKNKLSIEKLDQKNIEMLRKILNKNDSLD